MKIWRSTSTMPNRYHGRSARPVHHQHGRKGNPNELPLPDGGGRVARHGRGGKVAPRGVIQLRRGRGRTSSESSTGYRLLAARVLLS
jgi:hypothetical protein